MFEELDIFLDDRPDALDAWCEEHLAFLALDVHTELDVWIGILRHGAPCRRPRARATVITNLRSILPFLTEYAGKYTTLRQATRDDITSWLADRPYRA